MYYTRSRSLPAPAPFQGKTSPFDLSPYGLSMSDVHNRKGQNNECSARHVVVEYYGGRLSYRTVQKNSYVWFVNAYDCLTSGYCAFPTLPNCQLPDLLTEMNADVCDYIREAGRSSFHAISFARELASTISMLKNPFKIVDFVRKHASKKSKKGTFKSALRSAHSRKPKSTSARSVTNAASNAWLEGTYGWNPFVGDLLAAADLLRSANKKRRLLAAEPPHAFEFKKSASINVVLAPYYVWRPYGISGGSVVGSVSAKYYGSFKVNPSAQAENGLTAMARAINLDRIGYALWDAVPYSFVVDWFLPLGGQLDDLMSGPAFYSYVDTPWLSYQIKRRNSVLLGPTPGYANPYGDTYQGAGKFTERHLNYQRHPCDIAVWTLKAKNGMHGTRIASGAALAWGLLERFRR